MFTLYELDSYGEASGVVRFYCSEDCLMHGRSELGAVPCASEPGIDGAIDGTVCDYCGAVLVEDSCA